ncbi:MAG TPA: hypothetical protein VGG06_03265 [Thermoanaerobaculia bacterium]
MLRNIMGSFLLMTALAPALPAEPAPTPESQLLLPYFEVSLKGMERMTFFSIANSSSEPIELTATIYTNWAIPIHEVPIVLEAKQVLPVNLHDWLVAGKLEDGDFVCSGGAKDCLDLLHIQKALAGQKSAIDDLYYSSELEKDVATGFITFKADQGFLPESDVLWGDYFYTDPVENFAQGERLVRLEPDLDCADLCFRHSIRFLEGGVFTGGTKLTVWNWNGIENKPSKNPAPPFALDQAQLDVYSQSGDLIAVVPKEVLPVQTIVVSEDEGLKLSQPFGWFDLSTFQASAVSGLYRAAGRFSVGVPAWCLPCDPCNESGPCYDPGDRECRCFPAGLTFSGSATGTVGQPFLLSYHVSGTPPIDIHVSDLPAGLVRIGTRIEGVPEETGTFTINAANECGNDEITVTIGPPLEIDFEGRLTLVKQVQGGGPLAADAFTLFYTEQGVRRDVTQNVAKLFAFSSANGFVTVKAGEDNREGYVAGVWTGACSADGTVTIAAGDDKTCTITNTYNPARLTLIKHVVNDDGGTAQVASFPLFANGTPMTSGVAKEFLAGTYQASEAGLPDYVASGWSGDCAADGTVTLNWGDDKTCHITNDDTADPPAKIRLTKRVINDDGGTAVPSHFPLFLNGRQVTSGAVNEVPAGTYVASEQNLPGYTAGSWTGDCAANGSVTLAPGDFKECEITNDDKPAMITLVKYVSGGSAQVSDFPLFVGGTQVTSSVANKVAPGTYVASEQNLPNYTASSWSGDCSADGTVTLALGDDKRCEITNTYVPPKSTLKLIKHVVNDNGGTAQVSDFALFVGATQVTSGQAVELAPGTYQASEQSLPDYQASSWSGDCAANGSVSVALGEHKVCEITNTYQPPACEPAPTFSIWNADVDYNREPHNGHHHTEVRFSFRVGGEVDGEVQIFWKNGSSTFIKKKIDVDRECDDAETEGNLFWESDNKSHHPEHGAKYFARLVIGGQVIQSIPLN